jgi:hypothetical protein
MNIGLIIATLGSAIAALGTLPYIMETIKGTTKPRVVSWLTWSLLMFLATAGCLAAHQYASAIFSLFGAIATGFIVIAGFKYGDRHFAALDIACMGGVLLGLILWRVFNSPSLAVWAAIIIDFVGLIPTLKHSWMLPEEETVATYILVFVGGVLTVAASSTISGWSVTSVGYPLYSALSLGLVACIVYFRKRITTSLVKETLQENENEI